ncbi:Histone acetyltransferase [Paramicrosporidium saccamoebae]|uniref:histone acetyltransferase n=1 Tax=Paramicrosporidium saccamoebae TaxID=1246581 RepID=A0A2H9TM31_9FUNG|nr:Histone acetyltransferase [Paramicrosporidium saccamoebae]
MTAEEFSLSLDTDGVVLKPGTKLQVQNNIDGQHFYHRAEIMSTRLGDTGMEYYVHYIDFNKRLDEWVTVGRMDLSTAEVPNVPEKVANKTPASKKRKREKERRGRKVERETLELGRSPSILSSCSDAPSQSMTELSKTQELEKLRRGGSMTQRLEEVARVKNIDKIEMGAHVVRTWYFSSYPQEICGTTGDSTVFICEFCLGYFGTKSDLTRHCQKCTVHHPPGTEIYRGGGFSFWELDGHKQKTYCRNLCLLSKLFLDHKTLFYDVDPFLFYVLTENDARGCHFLGYFSKEKESADNYNVACILTLPQHQRKGHGKLLIDFSYELTKREGKVGSPEKPLSDLGLLSYRSYWSETLVSLFMLELEKQGPNVSDDARFSISIEQLSKATGFTCEDIIHTLQAMDALRYRRGQHIVVLSEKHVADYEKNRKRQRAKIEPKLMHQGDAEMPGMKRPPTAIRSPLPSSSEGAVDEHTDCSETSPKRLRTYPDPFNLDPDTSSDPSDGEYERISVGSSSTRDSRTWVDSDPDLHTYIVSDDVDEDERYARLLQQQEIALARSFMPDGFSELGVESEGSLDMSYEELLELQENLGEVKQRGMDDTSISRLPGVKYTVGMEVGCVVCMTDFAQDECLVRLPCMHHFHQDCAGGWLRVRASCPVCREIVPNPSIKID